MASRGCTGGPAAVTYSTIVVRGTLSTILPRGARAVIAALALAAAAGCTPKPSVYPQLVPCADDATVGANDVLEVRVMQQDKYSADYAVDPSGVLSFPDIGLVKAAGKTLLEIESDIKQRLADGYLRDPQVTVQFKERNSKKVSVFGEVRHGLVVPFADGMTVSNVIADAGGFTPRAWENDVQITRKSPKGQQEFTVPVQDIASGHYPPFPMCPGDSVYVPRSPI